jgi:hypothetical protein
MQTADRSASSATATVEYGPRVDLTQLANLFAPQTVTPFTPPPAGIDNLGITSTDTFVVPGLGEATVDFRGYVRVARSNPTASGWSEAEVYTNLIEMRLVGEAPQLGQIIVTLNPNVLSTGQIKTPFGSDECDDVAKACRMAVGATFEVPRLGKVLFNKEPILLTIDNVRSIPPAGNPGEGRIYELLPLYDRADPDGRPAAYLTRLKFAMGTYLNEADLAAYR